MKVHRIETVIHNDKTVMLKNLPFQAGEAVEVVISQCTSKRKEKDRYPLRGTSIEYVNPTEPVADGNWGAQR